MLVLSSTRTTACNVATYMVDDNYVMMLLLLCHSSSRAKHLTLYQCCSVHYNGFLQSENVYDKEVYYAFPEGVSLIVYSIS